MNRLSLTTAILTALLTGAVSAQTNAGIIDHSLSLKSVDEALAETYKNTSETDSKLKLNYTKTTFLEHDPLLFQHKTQFAQADQNELQVLQQTQEHQRLAKYSDVDFKQQPTQSVKTNSTLSPQIIAATNNGERSYRYSNALGGTTEGALGDYSEDDYNQSFESNETPDYNDNDIASLTSDRYQEDWEKIIKAQESHASRWQQTQDQKLHAQHLSDLQRANVRAENNLKLPAYLKKKKYKSSYSSSYPAPNHRFINVSSETNWVNKMMQSSKLRARMPNSYDRKIMLKEIYRQASRHGLKPDLILALIQIESNFRPTVNSHVGAQGLMQIMPFWKKEIGSSSDNLHDITTNIRYGTRILKHYLNIEKGNLSPALARYNGSYGRAKYPNKVIGAWLRNWKHL